MRSVRVLQRAFSPLSFSRHQTRLFVNDSAGNDAESTSDDKLAFLNSAVGAQELRKRFEHVLSAKSAQRLIVERASNGPFENIEQLCERLKRDRSFEKLIDGVCAV